MRPARFASLVLRTVIAVSFAGCGGGNGSSTGTEMVITTLAGGIGDGGLATDAPLAPFAMAVDPQGDIYLADHGRVRRIDAATGRVTSIAGGSYRPGCTPSAAFACLGEVDGLALDPHGNVFASDTYGGVVIRVDPATGAETLVVHTGLPSTLATDRSGNLFVKDADAGRVFRVDARTGEVTTVAGTGDAESFAGDCPLDVPATATCIGRGITLAVDHEGGLILSGDVTLPLLRRVDPATGVIATIPVPTGFVAVAADGALLVSRRDEDRVIRADPDTYEITTVIAGTPDHPLLPAVLAVDPAGRILLSTFTYRLLRLDRTGGAPEVIGGNGFAEDCGDGGLARDACLGAMNDVDVAGNGDVLIAERSGHIRAIAARDGSISTIADLQQSAFPACAAPSRLAVGPTGDVFVAGVFLSTCRIERATGAVSLVAGGTSCDGLGNPAPNEGDPAVGACLFVTDILVQADGGLLIADNFRRHVWRVDADTGRLSLIAGNDLAPSCVDGGDARAACVSPFRIAEDGAGNLYVLDDGGFTGDGTRVRRIDAVTNVITTVAGIGLRGSSGDDGPAVLATIEARNLQVDAAGNVFLGGVGGVRRVDAATGIISTIASDPYQFARSLDAIDAKGRLLFFSDETAPRLRRLTPAPGH